ncbi:sialate O-acetylesterase [Larkinella insperata]|uniref:Sialate O-acetylesterase n=1 Tax=Larkinella insperata TaxID=332158 RepID=A0ABW3QB57_9BACT|nr:sialate O-acetylesterase [Larkinella insperata]
MKRTSTVLGWIILLILPSAAVAQGLVKWQQWPAALQLYPRDEQNKAEVPLVGQLQSPTYTHVSVWVYQNGTRWKYARVSVTSNGNQATFQLLPTIDAGLNLYRFEVFAIRGKDSVRVDSRDDIVCGDVILFHGQSNITGYYPDDYFYRNKFLRTFGNSASARPDTLWHLSNERDGQVGRIGTEVQRLIMENFGMPTCLINGAVGGTSIKSHLERNPANPADPKTLYGKLLYLARKAGVAHKVKAFVWRQGENEAGGGRADGYELALRTLFDYWQNDYPNVGKFYIAQVSLLPENNPGAAQLRDFQRRTPQLFPRTEAIATVGLAAYDGVHYGAEGHYQFALELYRLIARDGYGSPDVDGIASPAIRKAYYRTAEKKEVVLEFEPGARMVWKQDTVVKGKKTDLRDLIYFDYAGSPQARLIESGSAERNRIILQLAKPLAAQTITYLPNSYPGSLNGPFLKNRRGMRAFTFHNVAISEAPTAPPDTLYGGHLEGARCDSIWGWVEAEPRTANPFITVEILANNAVIGTVNAAESRPGLEVGQYGFRFPTPDALKDGKNQVILVRVRGHNFQLTGGPKTVNCPKKSPILATPGLEALTVSTYPNPAQGRLYLKLFIPGMKTATLRITDLAGRLVWQKTVPGQNRVHEEVIELSGAGTQTVLVTAQIDNRKVVRKVVVVRYVSLNSERFFPFLRAGMKITGRVSAV